MMVGWTWEEEEELTGMRKRDPGQDGSKGGGQGGMVDEGEGERVGEQKHRRRGSVVEQKSDPIYVGAWTRVSK